MHLFKLKLKSKWLISPKQVLIEDRSQLRGCLASSMKTTLGIF